MKGGDSQGLAGAGSGVRVGTEAGAATCHLELYPKRGQATFALLTSRPLGAEQQLYRPSTYTERKTRTAELPN